MTVTAIFIPRRALCNRARGDCFENRCFNVTLNLHLERSEGEVIVCMWGLPRRPEMRRPDVSGLQHDNKKKLLIKYRKQIKEIA